MLALPVSGCIKVARIRNVVDLPAPFEPSRPVMLPSVAEKLTSVTAFSFFGSPRLRLPLLGNDLDMDSTMIMGVAHWPKGYLHVPLKWVDDMQGIRHFTNGSFAIGGWCNRICSAGQYQYLSIAFYWCVKVVINNAAWPVSAVGIKCFKSLQCRLSHCACLWPRSVQDFHFAVQPGVQTVQSYF